MSETERAQSSKPKPGNYEGPWVPMPSLSYTDLMNSARHRDIKSAGVYLEDSTCMYWATQSLEPAARHRHRVGLWKSPYVGEHLDSILPVAKEYQQFQASLPTLAERFMVEEMQLGPTRVDWWRWSWADFEHRIFRRHAAKTMEDLPPAQALLSLLQGLEAKPDEAFMTQAQEMMEAMVLESELRARMELDKAAGRNKRVWDDGDEVLGATKKRATVDGAADGAMDGAVDGADDDEKEAAIVFDLEVTEDLCHWSEQWKRLAKEGDRKKCFFFCAEVKGMKPHNLQQKGASFRKRCLAMLNRFEACINDCHLGSRMAFFDGPHNGKFTNSNPKCNCTK